MLENFPELAQFDFLSIRIQALNTIQARTISCEKLVEGRNKRNEIFKMLNSLILIPNKVKMKFQCLRYIYKWLKDVFTNSEIQ